MIIRATENGKLEIIHYGWMGLYDKVIIHKVSNYNSEITVYINHPATMCGAVIEVGYVICDSKDIYIKSGCLKRDYTVKDTEIITPL